MRVTGTVQQEAWQRRELPPAERVTGGVWSVPVPVPDNPVRYVLSYAIEHASGFALTDPGWNDPASWEALTGGLAACGVPLTAVTAVLVTHVHPDHHGLSGAVRERTGAWIGMHAREDALLAASAEPGLRRSRTAGYLRWCGAPLEHVRHFMGRRAGGGFSGMARADRLLADGVMIDVPGLRLRAVWTPGHAPGHLCFHDETHGVLLTGDHVLPRITPNVPAYDLESEPLAEYLDSLDRLAGIDPAEVLPAHEYRFAGLEARLGALREHHAERLTEAVAILRGPAVAQSAWQVATQVSWRRRWDDLSAIQRHSALGEVVAYLRHLRSRRIVTCADGTGVGLWAAAASA